MAQARPRRRFPARQPGRGRSQGLGEGSEPSSPGAGASFSAGADLYPLELCPFFLISCVSGQSRGSFS